MKKKSLSLIPLFAITLVGLYGCNANSKLSIIFTNDVHCAIEENIGYSGLSAYTKNLKAQGNETLLLDCGDHVQGAPIGNISKGKYIIEIMNEVGYDYAIPGNHEFDYSAKTFVEEISTQANFKYLSSNLLKTSDNKPVFSQYVVVKKAKYKIGLVGISTPQTITDSLPKNFNDENGNQIYTFLEKEPIEKFYENIQESVNKCLKEKADYVIALAHLGINGTYNSEDLIKNVSGLDVLLDGHSHSVIEPTKVKDKMGNDVVLAQTGTELNNIGNILVSKEGLSVSLINKEDFKEKDEQVSSLISSIKERYEKSISRKIGHTNFDLTINDSDGKRLIRKQSTNMGDLVADSFKAYADIDVGLINGGGVRANIPAGDITLKDAMTVCPFENAFMVAKVKGQAIKDMLEYGASGSPEENPQISIPSGLTYEINTSIPSPVITDNSGNFIKIEGNYRVQNILVNGSPINLDQEYKVGGTNYNICDSESSKVIFKDAQILPSGGEMYYSVLIKFIEETLNGEIPSKYENPLGDGRISLI